MNRLLESILQPIPQNLSRHQNSWKRGALGILKQDRMPVCEEAL